MPWHCLAVRSAARCLRRDEQTEDQKASAAAAVQDFRQAYQGANEIDRELADCISPNGEGTVASHSINGRSMTARPWEKRGNVGTTGCSEMIALVDPVRFSQSIA